MAKQKSGRVRNALQYRKVNGIILGKCIEICKENVYEKLSEVPKRNHNRPS